MPDVGILTLQIRDDSQQAVKGLDSLAGALKRVKNAINGTNLGTYANSMKKLSAAIESSANSYHTLGRLATALEKVKAAVAGFRMPDFSKLESLARSLQDNYTAAENLSKMGKAMQQIKDLGDFKMPNMKGIDKVVAAMDKAGKVSDKMPDNGGVSAAIGDGVKEKTDEIKEATDAMVQMNQTIQETSAGDVGLGKGMEDAKASIADAKEQIHQMNEAFRDDAAKQALEEEKRLIDEVRAKFSDASGQMKIAAANMVGLSPEKVWNQTAAQLQDALSKEELLAKIEEQRNESLARMNERMEEANRRRAEALENMYKSGDPVKQDLAAKLEFGPSAKFDQSMLDRYYQTPEGTTAVGGADAWSETASAVRDATEAVGEYTSAVSEASDAGAPTEGLMRDYGPEMVDNLVNCYSHIDLMSMKMEGMKQKLADDINMNRVDTQQIAQRTMQIQKLSAEIDALKQKEEQAKNATGGLRDEMDNLKTKETEVEESTNKFKEKWEVFKKTIKDSGLGRLAHQFATIAKRMAIRAIIKQVTAAFKEGTENVYRYSQAIGSSFSKDMDGAASSLATMKNSIGAAVAPMLQSIIPVVQSVCDWFITLINYVNQFVALMRGQATWTRATKQSVKAFDDTTKAAKKTGSAIKDLLADWDELNIIQSEGSGGGGGTGTNAMQDYLSMFEEVGVYDNKIRKIVEFIKDNFETIKTAALAIGAAILAWKISNAFEGSLSKLGALGLGISVVGISMSVDAAYRAGSNGEWSDSDTQEFVKGAAMSMLGGAILGWTVGGPYGAVIGAVVGLGIDIAASVIAYNIAEGQRLENISWGTESYTPEQVKAYLESQFTFDINATINNLSVNITNRAKAKQQMKDKVGEFLTSLDIAEAKVRISVDDSHDAIEAAGQSAITAIKEVETWLKTNEQTLATSLSIIPMYNSEGENVSDSLLDNLMVADQTLTQYYEKLGAEIADAVRRGQATEWAATETQAAMELFNSTRRVLQLADDYERAYKLQSEINKTMNFDEADGNAAAEAYKQSIQLLEEAKTLFVQDRTAQAMEVYSSAAQARAAAQIEREKGNNSYALELEAAAESYEEIARLLEDTTQIEADWARLIGPTYAILQQQWAEKLAKKAHADNNEPFSLGALLSSNPNPEARELVKWFEEVTRNNWLSETNDNELFGSAAKAFGLSMQDVMFKAYAESFATTISKKWGIDKVTEAMNALAEQYPVYAQIFKEAEILQKLKSGYYFLGDSNPRADEYDARRNEYIEYQHRLETNDQSLIEELQNYVTATYGEGAVSVLTEQGNINTALFTEYIGSHFGEWADVFRIAIENGLMTVPEIATDTSTVTIGEGFVTLESGATVWMPDGTTSDTQMMDAVDDIMDNMASMTTEEIRSGLTDLIRHYSLEDIMGYSYNFADILKNYFSDEELFDMFSDMEDRSRLGIVSGKLKELIQSGNVMGYAGVTSGVRYTSAQQEGGFFDNVFANIGEMLRGYSEIDPSKLPGLGSPLFQSSAGSASYNDPNTAHVSSAEFQTYSVRMEGKQDEENGMLREILIRLARLENKEWIAKAVPSSSWASHNARSSAQFERVNGV